jgi:hypothetical protein
MVTASRFGAERHPRARVPDDPGRRETTRIEAQLGRIDEADRDLDEVGPDVLVDVMRVATGSGPGMPARYPKRLESGKEILSRVVGRGLAVLPGKLDLGDRSPQLAIPRTAHARARS